MTDQLFNSGTPMKIGDTEFTASIFSDKDWGDINEYIRAQYLRNARNAAKLLDEDERRELMTLALSEAPAVNFFSPEANNILFTLDGSVHVGYQMIRKRHPKVTYEKFKEEVMKGDPTSNVEEIWDKFEYFHIKKKDDKGGSSAENNKSDGDTT